MVWCAEVRTLAWIVPRGHSPPILLVCPYWQSVIAPVAGRTVVAGQSGFGRVELQACLDHLKIPRGCCICKPGTQHRLGSAMQIQLGAWNSNLLDPSKVTLHQHLSHRTAISSVIYNTRRCKDPVLNVNKRHSNRDLWMQVRPETLTNMFGPGIEFPQHQPLTNL